MSGLIQFKFGREGEMDLVVHRELWVEICKAGEPAEADGDYVRIHLSGMTGRRLLTLMGTAGSDNYPCRTVVQLDLEP